MLETIHVKIEANLTTYASKMRSEIYAMWRENYGTINVAKQLHQISNTSLRNDKFTFSFCLTQRSELEIINSLRSSPKCAVNSLRSLTFLAC